jgi:hypothetical protein
MFESLLQDIRYATRALLAKPGFAAAALVTLALAIGANTLVFSLVDALYLAPLPYRDDARLVDVENAYPGMGLAAVGASIPDYLDRRAEVHAFADSALYAADDYNLALDGSPERVHGIRATPSLFSTLGVATALGRAFDENEAQAGADKVVVLSDALWRNRFGADASAIGRDLHANGELPHHRGNAARFHVPGSRHAAVFSVRVHHRAESRYRTRLRILDEHRAARARRDARRREDAKRSRRPPQHGTPRRGRRRRCALRAIRPRFRLHGQCASVAHVAGR